MIYKIQNSISKDLKNDTCKIQTISKINGIDPSDLSDLGFIKIKASRQCFNLSGYKIDYLRNRHPKNGTQTKNIYIINSHLPIIDVKEINTAINKEESEFKNLYNSPFKEHIEKIKPELCYIVNNNINLQEIITIFEPIKGFEKLFSELIKLSHNFNSKKKISDIKGKVFELYCAYFFHNNNDPIKEFNHLINTSNQKFEIDLITDSGKYIECKSGTITDKNFEQFKKQSKIAKSFNKEFVVVCTNNNISSEIEKKLKNENILFLKIPPMSYKQ